MYKRQALTGVWASNYDAMAQKTVLRNLLSKWGILSIEMQKAILTDESDADEQEVDIKDVTSDVESNVIEAINTENVAITEEDVKDLPTPTK